MEGAGKFIAGVVLLYLIWIAVVAAVVVLVVKAVL